VDAGILVEALTQINNSNEEKHWSLKPTELTSAIGRKGFEKRKKSLAVGGLKNAHYTHIAKSKAE